MRGRNKSLLTEGGPAVTAMRPLWKRTLCALLGVLAVSWAQEDSCPEVRLFETGDVNKVVFLQGCAGAPGPPGIKGDPGPEGAKGEGGLPGYTGKSGLQGQRGENGLPGTPGQRGEKGEKGDEGIPGDRGEKGDSCLPEYGVARDCMDLLNVGATFSGWYTIYPDGKNPLSVLCDMDTDGGGWIVFQRRTDGSVDFNRDWKSYKNGFGSQLGEFWLGNDNIRRLTAKGETARFTAAPSLYASTCRTSRGILHMPHTAVSASKTSRTNTFCATGVTRGATQAILWPCKRTKPFQQKIETTTSRIKPYQAAPNTSKEAGGSRLVTCPT